MILDLSTGTDRTMLQDLYFGTYDPSSSPEKEYFNYTNDPLSQGSLITEVCSFDQ